MNRRRFLSLLGLAPVAASGAARAALSAPGVSVSRFGRLVSMSPGPERDFVLEAMWSDAGASAFSVNVRPVQQAADELQRLLPDELAADVVGVHHDVLGGEALDVRGQVGQEAGATVRLGAGHGVEQRSDDNLHRHAVGPQPCDVGLVVTGHFGSPFVAGPA